MRKTEIQTVYEGDSFLQRLGRWLALLAVVFVIAAAVVISQRFQAETLALIAGLLIAGIPLLALAAVFALIAVKATRREPPPPQQMMMPPMIIQMPQAPQQNALPGDNGYWDVPQRPTAAARRSWDVLGEDD